MTNILSLPNDTLREIFSQTEESDQLSILKTCKKFKEVADSEAMWKKRIENTKTPFFAIDLGSTLFKEKYKKIKESPYSFIKLISTSSVLKDAADVLKYLNEIGGETWDFLCESAEPFYAKWDKEFPACEIFDGGTTLVLKLDLSKKDVSAFYSSGGTYNMLLPHIIRVYSVPLAAELNYMDEWDKSSIPVEYKNSRFEMRAENGSSLKLGHK